MNVTKLRKSIVLAAALATLASCSGKEAMRASSPEIDVFQCRMASGGAFVGVRMRVGADPFDPEFMETYLLDESTGEKFSVVRLQRIGRLAEFPVPGEKNVHSVLFRNRDGKLKVGKFVTLVVGSSRVEHLLLRD